MQIALVWFSSNSMKEMQMTKPQRKLKTQL
jgi:hypothetical protein